MTFEEFSQSSGSSVPPEGLSGPLLALWHAKQGRWDEAHGIVQNLPTREAAWVHAWLHRQEGDDPNARYWYDRAGKSPCKGSLDEEWEDLSRGLLSA